ncbi:MAG: SbcC/MukB-like Walker B domain-containing protein, partial [Vicinamibacterales bacterium]
VWTTVVQLRSADDELARLADARQRLEVDLHRTPRLAAAQDKAQAVATDTASRAADADRVATAALDEGQTRFQAAAVRAHLHTGEACPVCLQTVVLMPPPQSVPELDALGAARDQARTNLGTTQRALHVAGEKRAAAAASVDSARQARDAASAAFDQKATEQRVLLARIVEALAGSAAAPDAGVCAVVEERRLALRAAKVLHDRAAETVKKAEAAAVGVELALVKAEAEFAAATADLDRLERDEANRRAEFDEIVRRITAVSSSADPAAERSLLAQRLAALETALRTAQDALAETRTDAAAAVARHASASLAAAQAEAAVATEQRALSAALHESTFPDVAAATAAVRSSSQQTTLDAEVRRHESDRSAVITRLLDIEPHIANREVSAEAMATAEADCARTVDAWHQAGLAASTLQAACERLSKDVAARAALEQASTDLRARLALTTTMASDLRGDGFQEYLLEEAFHSLVTGASVRMRQMSNRYTLEWNDGDFFVVDHDNAGERRRAETLSGGETFMASLCLALQLSEEVLKTSGALQMDSLFIDEGFGTLDAESLAEVTDAMEALREDGGRLIGVISHRPELTERLPGCVRVVKGAGESTWLLERQG